MTTKTFTLATTERERAVHGVFTTALEGGIGYWSECSLYRWSDGTPERNEINEFRAEIAELEDGTNHVIDAEVIKRGIAKAYEHYRPHRDKMDRYQWEAFKALHWGDWDELDYDADTADGIVQFGLFGELVYG